jgi:hypothetical protein
MDPITSISATGAVIAVANKLLGKTADAISDDIANLYKAGRDKMVAAAARKTADVNDGKIANLRVARDVFINGSFTDEAICAEYFGGILASSRSVDGKDDLGVFYTDIIKSLSSSQLKLHYIIYHSLNKLWLEMPAETVRPNAGLGTETGQYNIWFSTFELQNLGSDVEKDLIALHSKALIGDNYEALRHQLEVDKQLPYVKVGPTTLGIQLYAVAHNKLPDWRKLPTEDFGSFPDIRTPDFFAFSLDEFLEKTKLK